MGGAGVRFLVILTMVLAGFVWVERPWTHHGSSPDVATLMSTHDPLVRRTAGWTAADRASITPGVRTFTGDGQCTADFVFSDAAGRLYLGQAAHCAETQESTNGCRARSLPLGSRVAITRGDTNVGMGRVLAWGRLAYSSWLSMQRLDDHSAVRCAYNDFALVRLPDGVRRLVNPSLPFWGGPTGLADRGFVVPEEVFGYGRSELRKAQSTAGRQSALAFIDSPETAGWSHSFMARSPGIPGDSGSGYLDSSGNAIGTLSTLSFGYVLINSVGDLRHELAYARAHSGIRGLRLELGTVRFNADQRG